MTALFPLPRTACAVALSLFLFASSAWADGAAAPGLSVFPTEVDVDHPRFPQSLIVSLTSADGVQTDITREARYLSSDANIVRVDDRGRIFPVAAGAAQVTVTFEGQSLEVSVRSTYSGTVPPVSYLNEVQPIISKAGCNQGACHGYSLGKEGFRLSLRGADPVLDHFTLTKEFYGRRLNLAYPEQSLILSKPSGDVPHQGGVRFGKDSDDYQRFKQWVVEDTPSDIGQVSELVKIEVFPKYAVLQKAGSKQQLRATAFFADGSTRDVTPLTIFSSNQEEQASVDDRGLITTLARGEAAVIARYERKFATCNVIAVGQNENFVWSNPAEHNFIDTHVFAKLRDLRMNPSDLCSDEAFLRRAALDLIGVQPTLEEVQAFLADEAPHKRERLIDQLLTRPEYVDRWSLKWADLLQNSRKFMPEDSVYAFRSWLRHAVASNMPLDAFTREVLTGGGHPRDDATAAYYRVSVDPNISLERTAQVFTGVRMLCARCHSHPFENWTQEDYFGLASFFNQVRDKADYLDPRDKVVTLNLAAGYAINPRVNRPQPPRFLGGDEPEIPAGVDRRTVFAAWLTAPENPLFAKSVVNRFWSYFFARGIIEPVDDLRTTNPPINPELLEALTGDFVKNGFDMRHLMRTIVLSRTYQLSSAANETNQHDTQNFSHAMPRRLTAEQIFDSLAVATGVKENIAGSPAGFRASQVPDTSVANEFLDLFGRPPREEACECERTGESNMLQALHMINGNTLLSKIQSPGGQLARLVNDKTLTDDQRIEKLYLLTLCRKPSAAEFALCQRHLEGKATPLDAWQDLMWALLNSSDFLSVN